MKKAAATLVVGIAVVLSLHSAYAARHLPPDHLFWAGVRGINVANQLTHRVRIYPLRAKSGKTIQDPVFTVWRHHVIYWSPEDHSFATIRRNRKLHWIAAKGKLPPDFLVSDMSPYPEGIVVSAAYDSTSAYKVNLTTGNTTRLWGVSDARSWSGSTALMVLNKKGYLELRSPGRRTKVLPDKPEESDWDYDFLHHRLYFIHDDGIDLIGRGGRWTPLPWSDEFILPQGIIPVGAGHQIWVLAQARSGAGLLLYNRHGKQLASWRYSGGDTPGHPMGVLDRRTLRALQGLSR